MLKVQVEDIMDDKVITVDDDVTVGQAAHILLRNHSGGVMVVEKGNKNNVRGIVTTTDLLIVLDRVLSKPGKRLSELNKMSEIPVIDIATTDIVRVQKGTKVKKLIGIMHKKHIHTIPVYDGDKLVGILDRHDILNAAFSS